MTLHLGFCYILDNTEFDKLHKRNLWDDNSLNMNLGMNVCITHLSGTEICLIVALIVFTVYNKCRNGNVSDGLPTSLGLFIMVFLYP